MTTKNINRTQQQAADQKLIDGLKKNEQTVPSLLIAGTSFKTADVIATLHARLATSNAAQSARAPWQTAVKADRDERKNTKTFVSGVRQALQVMFAGQIDRLADFGLTPRKAHVVTPEKKAAAALKAKATRAARHTMGNKQKSTIKGTVPQTAPATPPAATPPTVPTPAPAPATGPAPATTPRTS
jgi:hypothetical protein